MNKNYHHKGLFIFSILNVIFVLALYAYVNREIGVYGDNIVSLHQAKTGSIDADIQNNELERLYRSTESQWSSLPKHFVRNDDQASFIEALEGIGPRSQSDMKILSVDFKEAKATTTVFIGEMSVKIEVVGSWSSVMKTLKLTELMPYSVFVKDVRLDNTIVAGSKSTRIWKMSCNIIAPEINGGTPGN